MLKKLYYEHNFQLLEEKFGIEFDDKELLVKAFVHPSLISTPDYNYERLEFLGDSVLQIVVSDYMFRNEFGSEGSMSRRRALMVSEKSLAYIVRKNGMSQYLLLGKSLLCDTKKLSDSYVADIFESFVAAIYLDQGYTCAKDFVHKNLIGYQEEIFAQDFANDYKTTLQEVLQQNGSINLDYRCTPLDVGFGCELYLEDTLIGEGVGNSKKKAQQMAAKYALSVMVENEGN